MKTGFHPVILRCLCKLVQFGEPRPRSQCYNNGYDPFRWLWSSIQSYRLSATSRDVAVLLLCCVKLRLDCWEWRRWWGCFCLIVTASHICVLQSVLLSLVKEGNHHPAKENWCLRFNRFLEFRCWEIFIWILANLLFCMMLCLEKNAS